LQPSQGEDTYRTTVATKKTRRARGPEKDPAVEESLAALQNGWEYFNERLFKGQLPMHALARGQWKRWLKQALGKADHAEVRVPPDGRRCRRPSSALRCRGLPRAEPLPPLSSRSCWSRSGTLNSSTGLLLVPLLPSYRVRNLSEWRRLTVLERYCLLERSALLIGIDSRLSGYKKV
jgi:hypothetical protein